MVIHPLPPGVHVICYCPRDQSASATYILQENQEPNKLSKEWISYHRLSKDDDEFQLRNTQV